MELIDQLKMDVTFPIELAKRLEHKLRVLLACADRSLKLHDLITQAKDAEFLTEEAIDLAHIIRKQRNIIAHEQLDARTHVGRIFSLYSRRASCGRSCLSRVGGLGGYLPNRSENRLPLGSIQPQHETYSVKVSSQCVIHITPEQDGTCERHGMRLISAAYAGRALYVFALRSTRAKWH
jgi:hypothetical protein